MKVLTMFMDAIASSRALCTDPVVAEFLGFSRQRVEAACEAFKALKKKKEKSDLFAEDDAAASAVQPLSGLDLSEVLPLRQGRVLTVSRVKMRMMLSSTRC